MNKYFHFVILLGLVSFSPLTICDSKDLEESTVADIANGQAVVNALVSDPSIGERFKADGLIAGRVTRQLIQPGITEYVIYVRTCAMCDPGRAKAGFVTITEDVRPTYADGPVKYSAIFNIESVP